MLTFLRLVRSGIALGWCTGLAGAQWSVVETQEVQQGASGKSAYGTAIATDGTTALVAVPSVPLETLVYEIDAITGAWTEAGVIPEFGVAVAVSGDTAIIGYNGPPADGGYGPSFAHVFERTSSGWTLAATLMDPDPPAWAGWSADTFGAAVAISGDTIVVGSHDNDAAYVFERDQGGPNAWGYQAKLFFGDEFIQFGRSVAVVGDMVLVGAPLDQGIGAVFVFERPGANGPWVQTAKLLGSDAAPGDWFGSAVSLSGTTALVGAAEFLATPNPPGAAYVFERADGVWQEVAKLSASTTGSGELFGAAVALDSDTAVVADPEAFAACVFKRNHGGVDAWGQIATLPTNVYEGSVAVAQNQVAVVEELPGVSIASIRGLAFDPATGMLYGSLLNDDQLVAIDPSSGFTSVIGSTGFPDIEGLAFDPASGVLYGADDAGNRLVRIDPQTGAATAIGPFGFQAVRGLEFDAATNSLFGTDTSADQLLRIDVLTGDATAIGNPGFAPADVVGLAMDPGTGALYGFNTGGSQLIEIDPQTGIATLIGPCCSLVGINGLAMDPASGKLLGVDGAERLVEIDPQSGVGTVQETLWSDLFWISVNAVSHTSETYCTAGTSASGCTALIAASGQASASAPSGFVLTAGGVEGAKDGLFFFGSHGKQANPWGNGTSYQCVKPPVKRTGILAGAGTTGSCNGSFARDLNAFWCPVCPAPQANPGAGAMVQAQLWYRDPQSTSNQPTSLSDALELYVTP